MSAFRSTGSATPSPSDRGRWLIGRLARSRAADVAAGRDESRSAREDQAAELEEAAAVLAARELERRHERARAIARGEELRRADGVRFSSPRLQAAFDDAARWRREHGVQGAPAEAPQSAPLAACRGCFAPTDSPDGMCGTCTERAP